MYLKKVQKVILEKTGIEPEEVEPADYFAEDLNLGELELQEILEALEEEYELELTERIEEIETIEDLVTLLSEELD
ncbi:acyl carrier protein [candidate division WWE3 bacterium]|nr:acyl carrier protein [candidate division WWE3 bacterium]